MTETHKTVERRMDEKETLKLAKQAAKKRKAEEKESQRLLAKQQRLCIAEAKKETTRERRRERDRERKRISSMTPVEVEAERERKRIANMTPVEVKAERERKRIASMTPVEAEAERERKRIANMTPEQIEIQRERDLIANMTPEQIEIQRERDRIVNMTPEQIEIQRERDLISNMTPEQLEIEKQKRKGVKARKERVRDGMYLGHVDKYDDNAERFSIGDMCVECPHCKALSYKREPLSSVHSCCCQGKINVSPLTPYPPELLELLGKRRFMENIRIYNLQFAFASYNTQNVSISNGGPYVYKILGKVEIASANVC